MPEKMQIEFPQNDGDTSELLNHLINICSTEDQSKFLLECLDVLKRRSLHSIISASSAKGRGKSAVLGLAIAGAIVLKYSNIFISSLNYDNVKIIFKYLLAGLDAMQYKVKKKILIFLSLIKNLIFICLIFFIIIKFVLIIFSHKYIIIIQLKKIFLSLFDLSMYENILSLVTSHVYK